MSTQTGVGAIFSASHNDPVRKELHGHSYEVVAWFEFDEPRDAIVLQELLKGALRAWDHTTLPDTISRAEDLSAAIMGLLTGCVEVEIRRPLERLYARARPR